MRKRPLMLIACVFLAGLAYQRYSMKGLAVVGLLLIIREWYFGRKTKKLQVIAGRSVLLLSAFLLGSFHMQREMDFRFAYMSKLEDGSRITVWGELIKMDTTEYGNRGILSDCYIDIGEGILPCNDIMVYTSEDHSQIGQIHKITGKVNIFSRARNEGNFDSFVYYQSLKIDFAVDEEACEVLSEAHSSWRQHLLSLRTSIGAVYEAALSDRAAGFYQAMVLGDKTELDELLKELFLLGGISHILAISGLHVSIIGRGLYRLLRRGGLGFGLAGVSGGVLLFFYCLMVGSSASTVRAVGMMLFFFLAQWLGRSYDMLNALGGMVVFLLWENPFLIENSGFWFSVTALLGVGITGQELSAGATESHKEQTRKGITKIIDIGGLWMSLGITLTTLPVTALSYYEIPLYSPLVNFIVLPLLTPIFSLAVAGGLLGACFPHQGFISVLLQPCEWLLSFYEWTCRTVEKLPGATLICEKPELELVVLYYVFLFGGIYFIQMQRKSQQGNWKKDKSPNVSWKERIFTKRNALIATMIFLCSICIFLPKRNSFEITFLDVGQGDGIYISAGDGNTYFIDGGSSSVNGVGEYRILPFLKSKGVQEIDYWFVSHSDTDHISGLLEILEKGYKIEHLVVSERRSTGEKDDELLKLARELEIEVLYMKEGHRICSKDMEIVCLGPIVVNGEPVGEDENENSLILQVEWKPQEEKETFKALFAGDISTEIEKVLCQNGVLSDIDLFKANHHGSNYSNSQKLLETVRPEYIVVSCSKNNLYGHPGAKAVERMEACGAEIFYTMENGQVTFPLIQ